MQIKLLQQTVKFNNKNLRAVQFKCEEKGMKNLLKENSTKEKH